jgi:formate-dependent nitrite reductase membrane component NrfD
MPEAPAMHGPDEKPRRGRSAHDTIAPRRPWRGPWRGPTYYGRSQLKSAPFNNWVVGGYIFLAGISGAAALLSGLAEATRGRRAGDTARHGRYLALLAPTIGAALLVWDLHTPKRFYNMLRVAKRTSPMSIGTWILMSFSASAFVSAGAQFLSDARPGWRWPRQLARAAHLPTAIAGAGLCTYTASLLSATSTPLWAAAPRAMALRFGASSVATGAAALALLEPRRRNRRPLDQVALAALSAEFAATVASHGIYRARGVDEARAGTWGLVEELGVNAIGTALPIAIHAASLALAPRQTRRAAALASLAVLAGSLLLRVSMMEAGDESAADPNISFRFSQPGNLPR